MGNLADLFRWKKEVKIMSGSTVLAVVWVRLVGDSDYQYARTYALKKSRALRIKLRDNSSDEYDSLFLDLDSITIKDLIELTAMNETTDTSSGALDAVPLDPPEELGDDPSLEEQETYEKALEDARQDRVKKIGEFLENRVNDRKESLSLLPQEDMLKMYKSSMVDTECARVFSSAFRDYCLFTSTFEDKTCKKPAFKVLDDFVNASTALKVQIQSAYNDLEISGEDLKN